MLPETDVVTTNRNAIERPPAERVERKPSAFRPDIAGLRAVAVVLVVLYHAGLSRLAGGYIGVDVFFVISGFLITSQLAAEIDRNGRISLSGFYGRRAKRILPAAAVCLAGTAAAVWLFVPRTMWAQTGGDITAAAAYVINWRLANQSIDYLQAGVPPSPVQHFWSLAVEEQFYLIWPLLMIVAMLIARRLRTRSTRRPLTVALVVLGVPSLCWSIIETHSDPNQAFFVTTTRLWELAVGAGIALAARRTMRLPRAVAMMIGWCGLGAIIVSAFLVTADTAWPGYLALLPTLGAAGVIVAGQTAGRAGPVAVLGNRVMRWLGDRSYSLYLWHWPMLVIATDHWGGLPVHRGLAVATLAILPACISYSVIENPLRHARSISASPRFALSLGMNFTILGICAGLALAMLGDAAAVDRGHHPPALGAAVLAPDPRNDPAGRVVDSVSFMTPTAVNATKDIPSSAADGCFQQQLSADVLSCTWGDTSSSIEIVLAGDSKMEQWLPAFQELADTNHWKLRGFFKGACAFADAPAVLRGDVNQPYTSCAKWNATLLKRIVAEHPDVVVTSQGAGVAVDPSGHLTTDALVNGLVNTWRTLQAAGISVIDIANNPGPPKQISQCVEQNPQHLSTCAFPRSGHASDSSFRAEQQATAIDTSVPLIDLFDAICPQAQCPAVIGNVLIYRAGSHLTATYILTMAPRLAAALTAAGLPATM
jgi:peptidoglycan/LPS O-acetylase OafA/YrhL